MRQRGGRGNDLDDNTVGRIVEGDQGPLCADWVGQTLGFVFDTALGTAQISDGLHV